ncbi:replication-relaxation family protein [Paenibacillus pasadenensis]
MLQDIYEFYYIDYHAAKHRYFPIGKVPESSRSSYNRRMRRLAEKGLIAQVLFQSVRRKGKLGSSDSAYTLTKDGLKMLEDVYERELEWDTSRKDRKNIYVQHHVGVLYYVMLYKDLMDEHKDGQKLEAYYGEQSSRYQRMGTDNFLKDHIKPDATLFIALRGATIPWLIEYERESNASKTTILSKLSNYVDYAKNASYRRHDIMLQHDHVLDPVLVFYCDSEKVAERRRQLIRESKLNFYSTKDKQGMGDILFALRADVENDPYGTVYQRWLGERVSLEQINTVQLLSQRLKESRFAELEARAGATTYMWYPASVASHVGLQLDGIIGFQTEKTQAAHMVRYFPSTHDTSSMSSSLQGLLHYKESVADKSPNQILDRFKQNSPGLLLIVDRPEQEEELLRLLDQFRFEERTGWNCFVSRVELVLEQPFESNWLIPDSAGRHVPL